MAAVASSAEKRLDTTANTTVLNVHVNEATCFEVYVYARLTVAATLSVYCTYADGSEARSVLLLDGPQEAGSLTALPLTISAAAGTPVLVTAQAGTAGVAIISATIKRLDA